MTTYLQMLVTVESRDAELASQLRKLPNLEAVLKWAPSLSGIDSVQMDEYNYDILLPWNERNWLAFGVT